MIYVRLTCLLAALADSSRIALDSCILLILICYGIISTLIPIHLVHTPLAPLLSYRRHRHYQCNPFVWFGLVLHYTLLIPACSNENVPYPTISHLTRSLPAVPLS